MDKKDMARKIRGYREHGSAAFKYADAHKRKGKQSLNAPKRGQDNYVMEGKDEQEKE